ncbi:hypothetical protein Acr_03g0000680 [Actinidia rufa]|uniref:Oleosin n=1 Tax=Actinidia rufa TaxID=165716 RepID=A0A7J0E9X6_9ERIC|nr:hypothetical protein Acr_03g0000680 [Actinidia rufa]
MSEHYQQQQPGQPRSHQVVKAATAVTAGGPVLVPAAISMCLLLTGFAASGGFGVAAVTVFSWMYLTGKQPPGSEQLDQARMKLGMKAREMKDKAEQQFGQHQTGSQAS